MSSPKQKTQLQPTMGKKFTSLYITQKTIASPPFAPSPNQPPWPEAEAWMLHINPVPIRQYLRDFLWRKHGDSNGR